MKKTVFLLVFIVGNWTHAQDLYTVVKVVGKVENARMGREIRTGDKVESKDALKFDSPASYLIIINPKTGRKVIHSVPDSSPREFIQLLQSFVKPEERSTATRSGGMTYVEELGSSLSFHTLLILGEGKILVDQNKLSLRPPAVILAHYRKGSEWVYHKISDDKAFYLNRTALFDPDAQPPFHRVALDYYQNGNEDPNFNPGTPIANFVPLFVDEVRLKKEIEAIAASVSPSKTLFEEAKNYLVSEYGGIQDQNLRDWLLINHFIKE